MYWQDTRTSGIASMLLVCARPCAKTLLYASIAADHLLHFYILMS